MEFGGLHRAPAPARGLHGVTAPRLADEEYSAEATVPAAGLAVRWEPVTGLALEESGNQTITVGFFTTAA